METYLKKGLRQGFVQMQNGFYEHIYYTVKCLRFAYELQKLTNS